MDRKIRSFCFGWIAFFISFFSVTAPQLFAQAQPDVFGQWTTLSTTMPINPVHAALLHNGKVLVVSGSGNVPGNLNYQAGIWDPATNSITTQPVSWDMFCNAMVLLPDGRALIAGGTLQYDPFYGETSASVYDPSTNSFANVQPMQHGRWYPTATTLGDGRVMLFSGLDINGGTTPTVEIYTAGLGWSAPTTAPWTPPLYPRMHVLPNGNVFYSGPSTRSAIFNPSSQTWTTNVATTIYPNARTYGSSVLLPLTPANNYTPRVMIFGGGSPATATTEIIDLSQSTPSWQSGPSMTQGRIEMNAVMLPTGKVLALGGSINDEDNKTASLAADLYDPASNTFSSAGANAFPRLYHSVALLLPDGTVWVAGGNPNRGFYQNQVEIYQPAYLFTRDSLNNVIPATRPTISSAPSTLTYGGSFTVSTPDAANISSAVLVRAGAVTHAFDMDQRLVGLSFTADTTNNLLNVTAPANGNLAPPGYYMLFLVNSSGVPSVASWVQVQPAPPTVTLSATPVSRTVTQNSTTSYTFTLSGVTGSSTFSVSGLPSGVTASFVPFSNPNSAKMNVVIDGTTVPGTYPLTVTATNGSVSQSVTVSLVVKLQGSFTLTVAPTSQTITRGTSTTYTVTIGALGGFHWGVNLKLQGTTAHITGSLNPTTVTGAGTSTLTVNADALTKVGSHALTVTGVSASQSHSAKITLVVQ
jgi:hypothetical protein